MFGSLGLPELLIIFLIVMVLFGAGKLAGLGRGLGEGIRNFRGALKGDEHPKSDDEAKKS
ncbi:MAG: twin-arginine translocase TatA/TatE family subunit [Acidobacteriota bacterium]